MKKLPIHALFILILVSCSKKETPAPTITPVITGLACGSVSYSSTAKANTLFTATATIAYTGGNQATYSTGPVISSTGVTGLSAALQAGTLANGNGNITLAVSGTPPTAGTALFALSFGGQSCNLALTVNP